MTLLDRVPRDLLRNRLVQWMVLLSGPLLLSAAVWTANAFAGTAVSPDCGIVGVLVDTADRSGFLAGVRRLLPFVGRVSAPSSACQSVPFSADLPNMVLAMTAGLAVSTYVLFNVRLYLLREGLEASGLITRRSLERSGIAAELTAPRPRRRGRAIMAGVLLAAISLVGSAAMYYWLYLNGPIFRDLAGSYTRMGSPDVTEDLLRQNWWANHEKHPFNTALGIGVGTIGLFFALKQRAVFVTVGTLLKQVRAMPRPVEFVPKWLDRDYGWRPCAGLVSMGYVAVFVFLASFSAALYMLRSDQPGLSRWLSIILALVATIAGVSIGAFLASMIGTIRRLFADSVDHERTRILTALRQAETPTQRRRRRSTDRLYLLTEGTSLAGTPDYPISGRWRRLAGIVPAFVGAVLTFTDEVGRAFGI